MLCPTVGCCFLKLYGCFVCLFLVIFVDFFFFWYNFAWSLTDSEHNPEPPTTHDNKIVQPAEDFPTSHSPAQYQRPEWFYHRCNSAWKHEGSSVSWGNTIHNRFQREFSPGKSLSASLKAMEPSSLSLTAIHSPFIWHRYVLYLTQICSLFDTDMVMGAKY